MKVCDQRYFSSGLLLLLLTGCSFAQGGAAISESQGSKEESALNRQTLHATGIVTGRYRTGFFIQTPDDKADADPNTSEGIFVFTGSRAEPSVDAAVGNLVTVTGKVDEFRPRTDPNTLSITERSEEHMSELQSHSDLVCRLLLEKKKTDKARTAMNS